MFVRTRAYIDSGASFILEPTLISWTSDIQNHTSLINCQRHLLAALEKYERTRSNDVNENTFYANINHIFGCMLRSIQCCCCSDTSLPCTSRRRVCSYFLHALCHTRMLSAFTINNAWSWMVISLMKCHWWMDVVRVWTDICAATSTGWCFTSYYYYYWFCCCLLLFAALHFFLWFHFICKLTSMAYAINML